MRVCILTRGDLFPTDHGAAVKIVRTAEALSRLGEPCMVVTDNRDTYWRFVDGKPHAVSYPERFRAAEEWPGIQMAGRFSERLCGALGYPSEEFFLYRPMFDPAWWMRAVAVGVLENVDVFQAEFPGYGVPAWLAARAVGREREDGRRPRCSLVQHNVEWDRLAEFGHDVGRVRQAEQWVLDRMDEVIAVSLDDKRRMVAAGTDASKVTVVPHGVDVGRFERGLGSDIRERHDIDPSAPLLFFHGTLHYWPNTEAVRFIAEQLLPKLQVGLPDVRVVIAGQNPPQYYSHPAIVFPGSVPDLESYTAAADVCLCPIFAGGGTRMKLLEYMAAGRPIVSTSKGAEGIQYTDGEELIIAEDADTMAMAVTDLIKNSDRRRMMGRAAHRFAKAYDWSSVGEAYLSLYGEGEGRGEDWNPRFHAKAKGAIDGHLPPLRVASKPLTMLLLINRGCNLRCSFCDLWQDFENMDVQTKLLPLLDEAVAIGTKTLVITGGEPFLHPDLFLAVREAKARGLTVNITTNGTLIDKRWDELMASGVDSLSFSLDGMAETHDRIRGQKGAWKRTMNGLKRIRRDAPEVATSIYFVVTNQNVAELTTVYDLARSMDAHFDFWPVNDAPDLYLKSEHEQTVWRDAVAHIAMNDEAVAARVAYYEEGLDYHAGLEGPVRCLGLVDQYGVTYDGALLPCCVWGGDGLEVGNVFEQPLRELWFSPEVQEHRLGLYRDGCEVGCYNHSLYEFGVATGDSFRVEKTCVGS